MAASATATAGSTASSTGSTSPTSAPISNCNKDTTKAPGVTKLKRKRNRIPLSCTICRKRKVKCDKVRPHCNQCTRTGVAHLCHYMEQSWAEEAERELSKEAELKRLRDRVKSLEAALAKTAHDTVGNNTAATTTTSVHTSRGDLGKIDGFNNSDDDDNNNNKNSSGTSYKYSSNKMISSGGGDDDNGFSIEKLDGRNGGNSNNNNKSNKSKSKNSGTLRSGKSSSESKYDNDELDLTKRFDMLHVKNNGTVHLGATHWLAIMKGDPYLKLLWAHVFNIRERLAEWYQKKQRQSVSGQAKGTATPTTAAAAKGTLTAPTSSHHLLPFSDSKVQSRASSVVDYHYHTSKSGSAVPSENHFPMVVPPHPMPPGVDSSDMRKCPVFHNSPNLDETTKANFATPANSSVSGTRESFSSTATANSTAATASRGRCPFHQGLSPASGSTTTTPTPTVTHLNPQIKKEPDQTFQSPTGTTTTSSTSTTTAEMKDTHPTKETHPGSQTSTQSHGQSRCPFHPSLPSNNESSRGKHKTHRPGEKSRRSSRRYTSEDQVIQRVASLLPPRHIILTFVNKFFNYIYPLIPIIDERSFTGHLDRILVEQHSNAAHPKLRIRKCSDYCHLGIMIIILRLTWLSLPANKCEIDLGTSELANSYLSSHIHSGSVATPKEDNQLIKYETTIEALELVKDYLIKFDKISSISNNDINLSTIQFAVFYKIYITSSPTDEVPSQKSSIKYHSISDPNSQDSELNQILMSSIVQMALSCGLHRDPDNFPQLNVVSSTSNFASGSTKSSSPQDQDKENRVTTEHFKHTWRKLWYYIVHLDVEQSLALGSPRLLRNLRDFSDTKLPSASKIDYVRDIKELIVVKNYTLFWLIDLVIIAVLNHILNVYLAKNVRKYELDLLIESLANLTYGRKSANEVLGELINNGLLSSTEGAADYRDLADESYRLQSLEEILSTTSTAPSSISSAAPGSPSLSHSPTSAPVLPQSNGERASATSSPLTTGYSTLSNERKFELPHESTTKALFFSKHLTLRVLLYLLNYILFTHYEPLGSHDPGTVKLTKKYAQESLNYAMDGFRNCLIFFNNVKKVDAPYSHSNIFDYVNIFFSPHFLAIGHRALQFLVCLTLRAKCGPLTGMKDNSLFTGCNAATSGSSEESDSDSTNNGDSVASSTASSYSTVGDPIELCSSMVNDIHLDTLTDSQLANILIIRMMLFQKLTRQIAVQYPYANRTYRSISFFITLLHKSTKKANDIGLVQGSMWKHPKVPGLLNDSPSFVNLNDTDQIKKCPVYQDALGFMSLRTPTAPQSTQLPPIRFSYKPITYTNSSIRKLEHPERANANHGGQAGEKRRRLAPQPLSKGTSVTGSAQARNATNPKLPPPLSGVSDATSPLLPRATPPPIMSNAVLSQPPASQNIPPLLPKTNSSTVLFPVMTPPPMAVQNSSTTLNYSSPILPTSSTTYTKLPSVPMNVEMPIPSPVPALLPRSHPVTADPNGNIGPPMSTNNSVGVGISNFASQHNWGLNSTSLISDTDLTPNSDDFFLSNSNFGDVFDPSSIMEAINQFNPMNEVNNIAKPEPNSVLGTPRSNLSHEFKVETSPQEASSSDRIIGNTKAVSGTSMHTPSNSSGFSVPGSSSDPGPSPFESSTLGADRNSIMGPDNSGFILGLPKLEDGFTELQDFTIWD